MWRLAGDTATDYNHYSKRAILGAVYASTMAVFLNDESEDFAETRAFLARRIDQVMRFESWKHRRAARTVERPTVARFLGRLRSEGSGVGTGVFRTCIPCRSPVHEKKKQRT